MDSGSGNHICNSFESFDFIEHLDESIRVANGSSMSIISQGSVKLLCKQPNRASPFLLQLKDVYFILDCTVNLVSTFQLSTDSIAFDSEIPCLKAFGSTETLCSISQINRHYVLNAVPKPKSTFIEYMNPNLNQDIYLILSPLEHSLLLWHQRLGHASLRKIRQAIRTTKGIDLNIPTIKKLPFCEACAFSKSQKTISLSPQERTDRPGQKLYIDLARPITPIGISNVS
jgi:GAG-pre-integrase domain